jgi:uncharacterized protein (TIGR03118 family)
MIFVATAAVSSAASNGYVQTNLTSDVPGMAANLDPNLANPWGIAASGTSPFWTSDNGTGLSTLYPGTGKPLGLVVTIASPVGTAPPSNPTGVVFNTGASKGNFSNSPFIFDTEAGTIVAWTSGTNAPIVASGVAGSVYKGLGISSAGDLLYAANFGTGKIDVFDSGFKPTTVAGGFTDPNLPAGYSPFNIQNLGGNLYVTYARTNGGKDELDGPGLGFVDVFNSNGVLLKRLASQGALDAPWGLALAPSSGFGALSGDVLVGNFGDGLINAFDPTTGNFMGTLDDTNGNPISIQGLWGLSFGNGAQGTGVNTLYFNAGIAGPDGNREDHGLFGSLAPVPEPGVLPLMVIGLAFMMSGTVRRVLRKTK